MRFLAGILLVGLTAMLGLRSAWAAPDAATHEDQTTNPLSATTATEDDEAAIRHRIESYVAAFNAQDAVKLAEHWLPDAVYINPLSGLRVRGRDAITKEFEAVLNELDGAKLSVEVQTIRFISPSVAQEDGVAKILAPNGRTEKSRYTAIHVKRDGQWYLDRVTEEELSVVRSHYEHLRELEWMVGTWVDADEQSRVRTTCHWTRNKNYLIRWFDAEVGDRVEMAGVQIIGWDPAAKQIRSWAFDSDGGFAEGRWTKKGKHWFITTTVTLHDGGKASAIHVMTFVDNDRYTWRSIQRTIDGQLQPNIDEVVIVRAAE